MKGLNITSKGLSTIHRKGIQRTAIRRVGPIAMFGRQKITKPLKISLRECVVRAKDRNCFSTCKSLAVVRTWAYICSSVIILAELASWITVHIVSTWISADIQDFLLVMAQGESCPDTGEPGPMPDLWAKRCGSACTSIYLYILVAFLKGKNKIERCRQ